MSEPRNNYTEAAATCANLLEESRLSYADVILEFEGILDEACIAGPMHELLPPEYRSSFQGDAARIVLPDSKLLAYMRFHKNGLIRLLRDKSTAAMYRASSWSDLYSSDYAYSEYVFEVEAHRRDIFDEWKYWRGKFADLLPGDRFRHAYPPGIFAGDEAPAFSLEQAGRHLLPPILPAAVNIDGVDLAEYHFFLVNGFGIELEDDFIELPFGLQWWPAAQFPGEDKILSGGDRTLLTTYGTFCGVLLVPRSNVTQRSQDGWESLQTARAQMRRLQSILNVTCGARFSILADGFLIETDIQRGNHRTIHSPNTYRFGRSSPLELRRSRFDPQLLNSAINLCFESPKSNSLLWHVHKALDSLDLSRRIQDLPLAHVLTWTAIESLISPSDKMELISNMTLCLLGMRNSEGSSFDYWSRAKLSYKIRSDIVHSYSLPEHAELQEALSFAEEELTVLLQTAIEASNRGVRRDQFIENLKKAALDVL